MGLTDEKIDAEIELKTFKKPELEILITDVVDTRSLKIYP